MFEHFLTSAPCVTRSASSAAAAGLYLADRHRSTTSRARAWRCEAWGESAVGVLLGGRAAPAPAIGEARCRMQALSVDKDSLCGVEMVPLTRIAGRPLRRPSDSS